MTFQKIIERYLQALKKDILVANSSGEATDELSFRLPLDTFFKDVSGFIDPKIARIHEPKNQGKLGRPDWRFHNTDSMGVYGYVEAKGIDLNKTIKISDFEGQVTRYLALGNPIILTDGIDFIVFTPDGKRESFALCNKPINWDNIEYNENIEVLFWTFFKKEGYRQISEIQLINEVAKRARRLSDELLDLLQLEEDEAETSVERITIGLLKQLKSSAEESHDKSLGEIKAFAAFISQILSFGLLYAHRVINRSVESPKDKYNKIHDFWFSVMEKEYSDKLIPFKSLVHVLRSELDSDLSRMGIWYDDLRRLLAHVQLTSDQVEVPDFHKLYETFLSIFDPQTRFDYGAFYTPRSLAFYTVNLVKKIIKKSPLVANTADAPYKVIDPCCGTGTFIEAILEEFNLPTNSTVIGFEILPAPYALAHYRMTMLRNDYPDNIKIVLTNTLSDNLFEQTKEPAKDDEVSRMLLSEQHRAYELANPPLTVIIGNPPSSDSSFEIENEGENIKLLMEDFRPSTSSRKARQNIQKQLTNEFTKFLRWTLDRAEKSTPSVFALILPSGFVKYNSYKFARKYITERVSDIWILEFDTDNRTGADASNIFNTLQGRLLMVGIIADDIKSQGTISYKNICDLNKQQKADFFNAAVSLDNWQTIESLDENYLLRPSGVYDTELYSKFWPLTADDGTGVFLRHCSSLKLAPTHLLVHASEGQLKRRAKFIAKAENSYVNIKSKWYSGQQKPPSADKITDSVRKCLDAAAKSSNIYRYSYRPFIETYAMLDDSLLNELANAKGGGMRDRPEVRAAYKDSKVIGFAVAPAPEDLGQALHKFSSFCWNIPDNDLSTRGNAHIFCNLFPEYKKRQNWDAQVHSNINESLMRILAKNFDINKAELNDTITYYSYAILSSNYYLSQFSAKLFSVAGDWARIPITANAELFITTAAIGKELAEIESNKDPHDNQIDDTIELTYQKFRIDESSIALLDSSGKTVKQYTGISEAVLKFEISGYTVVREWLKLHSYPYYRKSLGDKELKAFETLLNKIVLYQEKLLHLDIIVEQLLHEELIEHTIT